MTRDEARRLLAIAEPEPTADVVRAAFRRQAKRVHPDLQRGEAAKRRGEERLKLLSEARSTLLRPAPPDPPPKVDPPPVRPARPLSSLSPNPDALKAAARRAWTLLWRSRSEPVVQMMGWVVIAWALVAHIY